MADQHRADQSGPPPAPPASGRGEERRIPLAAIAGAHGVRGEVRLKLFTGAAENLRSYGSFDADGRTLTLVSVRPAGGGAIARFAEIADRDAAEALRGRQLTVPRTALPLLKEGEYYHADLIGLAAFDNEGAALGAIAAVENFGAGDLIEVERPNGKRFLAPIHAVAIEPERVVIDSAFVE